jgi:5'-3' exonuclease
MRVLLIDSTNNFLRNYAVVPSLDKNGNRIGGVYGMLTTLSFFIKTLKPDRIYMCWDGAGGSKRRRGMFSEYKEGRKAVKPIRINSNYEFEQEDLEGNKKYQRMRLSEYLRDLPLTEITLDDLEADDIIAYLHSYFKDDQIIIASDDKDFFQLLDERTIIFRPTKREYYTHRTIVEKEKIYSHNFAMAKAIVGDKSDNINGVDRVGFKSLLKYFPFMSEEAAVTIERILSFSKEQLGTKNGQKYEKFIKAEDIIKRNFSIMQLQVPLISCSSISQIQEVVKKPITYNATGFRSKVLSDGITNVGETFFQQFRTLYLKGNIK